MATQGLSGKICIVTGGGRGLGRAMVLGACPRIDILSRIEAFSQNKHSHIADITSIIF